MTAPVRPRNDPAQYTDLAEQWWTPRGAFAMLHWIAAARLRHIPTARPGQLLLDVACGGGVLAPWLSDYVHVGIDIGLAGLAQARQQGVLVSCADITHLPFADATFDVVVAGEILEHVPDLSGAIAEVCRVLTPGGTLVIDTIADTWWARFSAITLAERMPAGPPRRMHDGTLFVNRTVLTEQAQLHGVQLTLNGLRPSAVDYLLWLARRKASVRMLPTRSTAGLFQAAGTKS